MWHNAPWGNEKFPTAFFEIPSGKNFKRRREKIFSSLGKSLFDNDDSCNFSYTIQFVW